MAVLTKNCHFLWSFRMKIQPVAYQKARGLIKEGDILLFRGSGLISFFIKVFTGGLHSHAAIAHWDDEVLQCVEFREFKGGRIVSLSGQVETNTNNIDIFRPANCISFDEYIDGSIKTVEICYTEEKAEKTAKQVIMWSGKPYGWSNILNMFKRYVPFVRMFTGNTNDNSLTETYVCSTAVAVAVRQNFTDLVPFMSDDLVSPADLARSPLLRYMFTIERDK